MLYVQKDVLVDMIVGYTKLYIHIQKEDISFEITDEKIRLFLSLVCIISFQAVKRIGRRTWIFSCKQGMIQCLVIHSGVFFGISTFVKTNNLIRQILEALPRL